MVFLRAALIGPRHRSGADALRPLSVPNRPHRERATKPSPVSTRQSPKCSHKSEFTSLIRQDSLRQACYTITEEGTMVNKDCLFLLSRLLLLLWASKAGRRGSDAAGDSGAVSHVTVMNGGRNAVVLLQVQLIRIT